MKEKLSISIVAYHNFDDIENAVRTIEQFTCRNISKTIYIVDNSEIPADKPTVQLQHFLDFIACYDDVQYLDAKKNIGFGKGHNFVLPRIDSEYHAFVNPDILFTEDAFAAILEYMDQDPSIGMCIPEITDENGIRQDVYRKEPTVFDMFIRMFLKKMFQKRQADHSLKNMDYTRPFQVPFGQGSFLVIRTELFKKLHGFDDSFFMYLEDADLCKRVNQVSKLMYFPGARVIHKWEKGSHKNPKLFRVHLQSMAYYFKKWGLKLF